MKNFRLRLLLNDARGAAAVELAFTLPVLITILGGILFAGFGYYMKADMQQALSQTARYSMLHSTASNTELIDKVKSSLVTPKPDITTITITDAANYKKMVIVLDYISIFSYNVKLTNEINIPI